MALFALLAVLCSCNPAKRVAKVFDKYPVEAARESAKRFPVSDTVTIQKDSVYFDTLYLPEAVVFTDTVFMDGELKVITRECPKNSVVTKYVNTDRFLYVRDRAYERTQSDSIQKLQRDNNKLFGQLAQEEKNASGFKKYKTWFWLIVGILLLLLGLTGYSKFIKPTINITK